MGKLRNVLIVSVVIIGAASGVYYWRLQKQVALPGGIASSNGRIEAVEIDIAAQSPGRIKEILVSEGDFIRAGQILAKMDTVALEAQIREARAGLQRARISVETTQNQVAQREAEGQAAEAVVAQRQAELAAARKRLGRSEELAPKDAIPVSKLDEDRAAFQSATAAVRAAKAQAAAATAAIGWAESNVVAARSTVEAAQATIDRIQAEIDDSVLTSPRDGRVQYRVVQPGEVLSPGGTVLNMIDLTDVYMTFFLPTEQAGRVAFGAEARIVLDAAPQYVLPARITFVADVAQFTPKSVETKEERQKLTFRIKARLDPELLRKHLQQVKTGLPGVAYVQLDPDAPWPPELQIRLPQ